MTNGAAGPGSGEPPRVGAGAGAWTPDVGESHGVGETRAPAPPPSPFPSPFPSPRDAGAWLAIAVTGFLVGQLASLVLLTVVAAAVGHLSDLATLAGRAVPPAWVVVSELVGLWVGFLGAVVVASRRRGSGSLRRDMGLELRPRDLVVGPVVGVAGQLLLLPLLYLPLRQVVPNLDNRLQEPAKHLTGGFPGADVAVVAVLVVVVVPVVEELFFRGLVLRALAGLLGRAGHVVGPVLAVTASGVLFGLAHFELLQLLGLAVFGVVLAALAYRMRRLGACMLAHAAFNLVAVVSVAHPTGFVHLG